MRCLLLSRIRYQKFNGKTWADGAFFGELPLLGMGGGNIRNMHVYSVTASVESDLTFLQRDVLEGLEHDHPAFKAQVRKLAAKRATRFGVDIKRATVNHAPNVRRRMSVALDMEVLAADGVIHAAEQGGGSGNVLRPQSPLACSAGGGGVDPRTMLDPAAAAAAAVAAFEAESAAGAAVETAADGDGGGGGGSPSSLAAVAAGGGSTFASTQLDQVVAKLAALEALTSRVVSVRERELEGGLEARLSALESSLGEQLSSLSSLLRERAGVPPAAAAAMELPASGAEADMVAEFLRVVQFLRDPRLQDTTREQQVSYLRSKLGLSDDEVAAAYAQAGIRSGAPASANAHAPHVSAGAGTSTGASTDESLLPRSGPTGEGENDKSELYTWLQGLGCGAEALTANFREHGFECLDDVASSGVSEHDLKELGITKLRQRKLVARAIESRQAAMGMFVAADMSYGHGGGDGLSPARGGSFFHTAAGDTRYSTPAPLGTEQRSEGRPRTSPTRVRPQHHHQHRSARITSEELALDKQRAVQAEQEIAVRRQLSQLAAAGDGVRNLAGQQQMLSADERRRQRSMFGRQRHSSPPGSGP